MFVLVWISCHVHGHDHGLRLVYELYPRYLPGRAEAASGLRAGVQKALARRVKSAPDFEAQAAPRKLGRFSTTMVPASLL